MKSYFDENNIFINEEESWFDRHALAITLSLFVLAGVCLYLGEVWLPSFEKPSSEHVMTITEGTWRSK